MYIKIKKNAFMHWWGESIVFIVENIYYRLEQEEVFLMKYFLNDTCVENVIQNIVSDIRISEGVDEKENIERFVMCFMENYSKVLEYSEEKQPLLKITGKEDKYFPFEIHISVTNRCYQRCKHCYKKAESYGMDLEFDKLYNFLEFMKGKTPFLTLSGGEPLLYTNIIDIIESFGTQFNICVMSSGYEITDEILKALNSANRGIWVSIYSSLDEIHDRFVGINGSLEKIIKNIKRCVSNGISVNVATFLNNDNEQDIIELIEMLIKEKVDTISISTITNIGRAKENEIANYQDDSLKYSVEKIKEMFGDKVFAQIDTRETPKATLSPFKCMAGSLVWGIHEDGNIYPCGINSVEDLKMGSLTDYSECVENINNYYNKIIETTYIKRFKQSKNNCPFVEV